jgi:chemotaxis response regulator CheB
MPGEAIELGAACLVLPADGIAAALVSRAARQPPVVGDHRS